MGDQKNTIINQSNPKRVKKNLLVDLVPGLGLEPLDVGGGEALRVLVLERLVLHHAVPRAQHAVDVLVGWWWWVVCICLRVGGCF